MFIKVKNSFVGFHQYVDAPEEVSFLRQLHRHTFIVRSTVEVFHDNRELEFYLLQEDIEWFIVSKYKEGNYIHIDSCEMFAEDILNFLANKYPNRSITVEVSEDDENSSIVSN